MKCFVARLTDDKYVNVQADRMELREDAILAYKGDALVAIVDKGVVLSAHISEKTPDAPTAPVQEQEAPQPSMPTQIPEPQPEQRPEPAETGYKGFLYIKCEACGSTRGFCAKTPTKEHRCKCGHKTVLRNLKPLYVNCECGEFFKYRTNLQDDVATINCIKCGSPVDLELHDKKGVYTTIGYQKED